jgi:hypothetical protein
MAEMETDKERRKEKASIGRCGKWGAAKAKTAVIVQTRTALRLEMENGFSVRCQIEYFFNILEKIKFVI